MKYIEVFYKNSSGNNINIFIEQLGADLQINHLQVFFKNFKAKINKNKLICCTLCLNLLLRMGIFVKRKILDVHF